MSGVKEVWARRAAVFGLRLGTVVALVLLLSAAAEARPYILEWDANMDGYTNGYRVYIGTATGIYDPEDGVDVGNVLEHQVNLTPGVTYYFAVRAYRSIFDVGPASTELVFAVPNVAPVLTTSGTRANSPGNVVSLQLTASDADNDGLMFTSVTGLPQGLSANGNGLISGTLTAGSAGTYSVTATVSDGGAEDVETFSWRVISFTGPSSINQGQTITANIAHAPGDAGDWVGLYRVGAAVGSYCDWNYLNGSKTPPESGLQSASLEFTSNCPGTGDLELRFFLNNTINVLATTGSVSVNADQTGVITVNGVTPPSSTTVAAGATLTAQVVIGGPFFPGDWVGLYLVGGAVGQYLDWKYLNGIQTMPESGTASATVTFTMPTAPGSYEIRLYSNSTVNVVATSSTLTTLGQTAAVTVNGVTPPNGLTAPGGSTLNADVSITGPAFAGDWVGLYPIGASVAQWVDWKYMNGTRTQPGSAMPIARLTFEMPSTPGNYEIRTFSNNTATVVGASSTLTPSHTAIISVSGTTAPSSIMVSTASVLSVEIDISGPVYAGDWAALYPVGGTSGQYFEWKYLNGTQTRPDSGTASASLSFTTPAALGSYEIRLFSNDTMTLVGTGPAMHASGAQIQVNSVAPPAALSVAVNSALTVEVDIPGLVFASDWVGLFPVGGTVGEWIEWKYLNGTQVLPGAGSTNGIVSFTAPAIPGNYEIRLYQNGTGILTGTSSVITVL